MLIGVRKKLAQTRTRDFLLSRLGASRAQVHYVQVGANDGQLDDPVFKIAQHQGWSGLLIEPNPAYFAALTALHGDNPKMTLVQCGVSSNHGSAQLFHLHPDSEHRFPDWARGCASLDQERIAATLSKVIPDGASHLTETRIDLVPLRTVLGQNGIQRTDLLVVDVEGHEHDVLVSANIDTLSPDLVLVESNAGLDDDTDPVRRFLQEHGYRVSRIGDDLIAFGPGYPAVAPQDMLSLIGFA